MNADPASKLWTGFGLPVFSNTVCDSTTPSTAARPH